MDVLELIDRARTRLEEVEREMCRPESVASPARMAQLAREHRRLKELVDLQRRIQNYEKEIASLKEAGSDPELAELAESELQALQAEHRACQDRLLAVILPEDPEDSRSAVLEIRAGTGGEEAALFAADLYKMYSRYLERKGWRAEVISAHFSDLGGVKEILVEVTGEGAFGRLRLESGVHRVQRIPVTEAAGRIHTSAATVAVLPQAEEIDVQIDPKDLHIDTYRSSSAGGQHVNKTESAVRITHLPTGVVVTCQDERSQLKNKAQAMKVLRSKLFMMKLDEEAQRRAAQRREQVSTGDRSAKIRTYNYPQNRVTDHRVPITIYNLEAVMAGDLDILLEPLRNHFARQRLERVLAGAER